MATNKKILFIVTVMLTLLSILTMVVISLNLKSFAINNAVIKSNSVAEAVRDGLTVQMISGSMDKKELFFENMIKHQNVKNLKVLQSELIQKQFSKTDPNFEYASELEKEVFIKRESSSKIRETPSGFVMNVAIPYIATKSSNPNCLNCHSNANEGDVLGVISMDVNIDSIKNESISIITKVIIITLVFLIIAIITTIYFIKPYTKLFEDLQLGINRAYQGDFSYKVETSINDNAGKVAQRLNDLSDIFRFKKTIESDYTEQDIYNRLSHILTNYFDLRYFIIFKINVQKKEKNVVIKSNSEEENQLINADMSLCRAYKTSSDVYSIEFYKICDKCYCNGYESICLPFTINENYSLILNIKFKLSEDINSIKEKIAIIKNYFEIAKPVLENKILIDALKENSQKDGLTKLYNRRYLNDFIADAYNHEKAFTVLMIDIDHFKEINDKYGHDIGDNVLKAIAVVINNNIRENDFSVRFGGEEFLVFLFDIQTYDALNKANTIKTEFSNMIFQSEIGSFSRTISIGIAEHSYQPNAIWQTIKKADIALYEAKNSGRNKIVEFDKIIL